MAFTDRREPIHGGYTATSLSLSSEKSHTPGCQQQPQVPGLRAVIKTFNRSLSCYSCS